MEWEWTWYTWAWIILFSGIGIVEVIALIDKRKNDSLSSHVGFIMTRKVVRVAVTLGLIWLAIHWATGGWI